MRWVKTFRWHLLPLFLSAMGQSIISRKYDAFTTDRAYENSPGGPLVVGRFIDWIVLQTQPHPALRRRLAMVVDELQAAVGTFQAAGVRPVRVVSAPVGLARDLILALRGMQDLELWSLDLDPSGDVLAVAKERAALAGLALCTAQVDLLDGSLPSRFVGAPVHVFNCIGLMSWLDPPQIAQLLSLINEILIPGGVLLLDNFRRHTGSHFGPDLEIDTRYHPEEAFEGLLEAAGFSVQRKQETSDGVCVLYTLVLGER